MSDEFGFHNLDFKPSAAEESITPTSSSDIAKMLELLDVHSLPPVVLTISDSIVRQFEQTARDLELNAEELRRRADNCDQYARQLREQGPALSKQIREDFAFERRAAEYSAAAVYVSQKVPPAKDQP